MVDVCKSAAVEVTVAATAFAALLLKADEVEAEPAADVGKADNAGTDVVVCVGVPATLVGVLVLAPDSLVAVPNVPVTLTMLVVGGVDAVAGNTSVCD